jgi:MoaA/NifB/PqqE/SkfB family radical SAM enzyme
LGAAGLSTSATFIATAANIDDLPRVADLLRLLGIKHLVVNELHPEGEARGRPELIADPVLVRDIFERVRRRCSGTELRMSFLPASIGDGQQSSSREIWRRMSITSNGDLKLCNQSVVTLGSLKDLTDDALDRLFNDLDAGHAGRYRDRVDRCRCFDRIYGSADSEHRTRAGRE